MMTPLATYLLNEQIMQVLSQRAVLRQNALVANYSYGAFDSNLKVAKLCGAGGSGVYFNNREVPQEMHIRCLPRQAPAEPYLPSGKPMPQPPRLMITPVGTKTNQQSSEALGGATTIQPSATGDKRKSASVEVDEEKRSTKRSRSADAADNALTSEQQGFIEAALALAKVKNSPGRKSPSTIALASYPAKTKLLSALPPPPFSFSRSVVDISNAQHEQKVAKSA